MMSFALGVFRHGGILYDKRMQIALDWLETKRRRRESCSENIHKGPLPS